MTQITLNIPDTEIDFFLKIVEKFNYTLYYDGFELNTEQIELLNKSSTNELKDCSSINEYIAQLKTKYAL